MNAKRGPVYLLILALMLVMIAPAGGETAAEDLARVGREGRKFISVEELSAACPKVSQAHLDALKTMGALGDMPDSSQISLFEF